MSEQVELDLRIRRLIDSSPLHALVGRERETVEDEVDDRVRESAEEGQRGEDRVDVVCGRQPKRC